VDGPTQIDWSTAHVRRRTLTVQLTAPPSAAWRERARAVGERLQRGDVGWRKIKAKKDGLVVTDVAEGAEDDLRHILTSIVLQANAGEQQPGTDQVDDVDARMTASFQSFDATGDDA
jgi:hypothetical protein